MALFARVQGIIKPQCDSEGFIHQDMVMTGGKNMMVHTKHLENAHNHESTNTTYLRTIHP